jgi:glycosyltransferase involved in cell wall biosynthesis
MKVAIYSPYLDTASGGEKYMLTIAEVLSASLSVDVLLDKHLESFGADFLKDKNSRIHGLNLGKVNFISAPIGAEANLIKKSLFLKQYDYLFFNTDGSFFISTAKNSIVHIQQPFDNLAIGGVLGKLKLKSWSFVIYNSEFTKEHVEKLLKLPGEVVYPPVAVDLFNPAKKKRQILSVGRFAKFKNPKKQDILIEGFKQLVEKTSDKNIKLCLAGGLMEGNEEYMEDLKKKAKGLNIEFFPNISLNDLIRLNNESLVYWHAMGFGETDPKLFEHFGISTVEAMAAGCVPIVINLGGQREIVEERKSGFLWDSIQELVDKTILVLNDKELAGLLSKNALDRSKKFSKEEFSKSIKRIVGG